MSLLYSRFHFCQERLNQIGAELFEYGSNFFKGVSRQSVNFFKRLFLTSVNFSDIFATAPMLWFDYVHSFGKGHKPIYVKRQVLTRRLLLPLIRSGRRRLRRILLRAIV